jgi:hypothetical protein
MKIEMAQQFFIEFSILKVHENHLTERLNELNRHSVGLQTCLKTVHKITGNLKQTCNVMVITCWRKNCIGTLSGHWRETG